MTPAAEPSIAEIEARLQAVIAKRGWLLPHHGLLAVALPDLLAGYDAAYTALALTPHYLDERTKEFIWLAILTAVEEAIAVHHVTKFQKAGGSDAEAELAIRLGGFLGVSGATRFGGEHWAKYFAAYDRSGAYRRALKAICSDIPVPAKWIELAMASTAACKRDWWTLAEHIKGAYAAGIPENELAEGISYMMFPGSIPNFVDACEVWRDMIRRGEVQASAGYRAWANIEGPKRT